MPQTAAPAGATLRASTWVYGCAGRLVCGHRTFSCSYFDVFHLHHHSLNAPLFCHHLINNILSPGPSALSFFSDRVLPLAYGPPKLHICRTSNIHSMSRIAEILVAIGDPNKARHIILYSVWGFNKTFICLTKAVTLYF